MALSFLFCWEKESRLDTKKLLTSFVKEWEYSVSIQYKEKNLLLWSFQTFLVFFLSAASPVDGGKENLFLMQLLHLC